MPIHAIITVTLPHAGTSHRIVLRRGRGMRVDQYMAVIDGVPFGKTCATDLAARQRRWLGRVRRNWS